LGVGPPSQIPNPQSPIPNPQSPYIKTIIKKLILIEKIIINLKKNNKEY